MPKPKLNISSLEGLLADLPVPTTVTFALRHAGQSRRSVILLHHDRHVLPHGGHALSSVLLPNHRRRKCSLDFAVSVISSLSTKSQRLEEQHRSKCRTYIEQPPNCSAESPQASQEKIHWDTIGARARTRILSRPNNKQLSGVSAAMQAMELEPMNAQASVGSKSQEASGPLTKQKKQ